MSLSMSYCLRARFLLLTLLLLGMHGFSAYAYDAGMTALATTSTDGKTYAAKFAAGLSLDNGQTFRTATTTGINVLIRGSIAPDPAHIGKKGDLFIVTRVGTDFFMRNTAGIFVPWSFRIPDLVPAVEDITLGNSHTLEVFKGQISEAKDRSIFLGYMPESGAALIYTPIPLLLSVSQNLDPISLFENTIFDQLVMARCALCHVKGGVADGRTGLLFLRDSNLARQNYDIFKAYFDKRDNAYEYTLSKASGGDRHVGGAQVAPGSADYLALTTFLTVLDGRVPAVTTSMTPTAQFFNGVVLQSNLKTLRRAAILLAGRAPTPAEQATVASGGDAELRSTLMGLMQGSVFHDFLKDGANDRLLVRGQDLLPLQPCNMCFPNYADSTYKNEEQVFLTGLFYPKNQYLDQAQYGQEEAPLELIASIIENDRPYSEILTADYMMFNPVIDEATNATATFASGKATEFRPGRITDYYPRGETTIVRQETRFNFPILVSPSTVRLSYPHVGILNDMAFMRRYPSTATNRNRARARWTFLHFLGVDIEQSAQRTTDALALADTNNPTMNNPNCQVCHAIMDPVAGAFQHYGDEGFYLESFGGKDALDPFYKYPLSGITPYRQGDTWYRDMRTPGFNGKNATESDTLRWLANQIVADPRFASAAARFWWPAIMGRELLKRPEVATDGDYKARLLAYDAQEAAIASLAANFTKSGLKVKTLLLDLLMSEWFRADRIDGAKVTATQTQAHWIAGLGNEKLLTPEQLARKTWALTGFNWKGNYLVSLGITTTGMGRDYALYYGGIDSLGVTQRSRELTPLMSATALNMALESSCPIVYGEFILPDAQRKLFGGVSDVVTPLTEASEVKVVDSADATQFKTFSFSAGLETGAKKVSISYLNEYCDWDAAASRCRSDRNVFIKSLTLQRPDGTQTQVAGPLLQVEGTNCGRVLQNNMYLYTVCTAVHRFTADQAGTWQIQAQISAAQAGPELAQVSIGFEDGALPAQSTSRGAAVIKKKLVELHQTLLGKTLAVDSPEITAAYTLLADTWQAKRTSNEEKHMMVSSRACNWAGDSDHMQYVGFPGETHRLVTKPHYQSKELLPWSAFESWYYPRGIDPLHMKKSWQVVIAYLLTHYNYLYE